MKPNPPTTEHRIGKGFLDSSQIFFVLIIFLGLFLRLWQLDKQPFWLDELGVARAAFKPALFDALRVVNDHVMAMPMDYVIAWTMAQISHEAGFLRLPEAVWGVLTLLAGYKLCRELLDDRVTSILAMLMMSVSPILIQYSQELRFYSPLTFFSVLSTWLGLIAVSRSRRKDWVVFTLSALAGLSFHFFSIMVMVSVFLWMGAYYRKEGWEDRRNNLAMSAGLYSIAFLTGIVIFGSTKTDNGFTLFQFESLSSFLITGAGWKPPYPAASASWIPGILLFVSAILGVYVNLRRDPKSPASILFYSVILQSILVVSLDLLGGYFISSRQIIMITPIMAIFSAFGVNWTIGQFSETAGHPGGTPGIKRTVVLSIFFGVCFLLASIPPLREYYQLKKTSTKEILLVLSKEWRSGEPIYADLGSENVYVYYGDQQAETRALIGAISPIVISEINQLQSTGPAWVIIRHPLPQPDEKALISAGFTPVFLPSGNTLYAQALWNRR